MTNADKLFEELFYKIRADNIDTIAYYNTITGNEISFWKRKREIAIQHMINIKLLQAIYDKANELWGV